MRSSVGSVLRVIRPVLRAAHPVSLASMPVPRVLLPRGLPHLNLTGVRSPALPLVFFKPKSLASPCRLLSSDSYDRAEYGNLRERLLSLGIDIDRLNIKKEDRSTLNALRCLYDESDQLQKSISLPRENIAASKPYKKNHISSLFYLLKEKKLLERLLQCQNISAVFQLSSLLLHENLEDCIETIIEDEQAAILLQFFNEDNAIQENSIRIDNQIKSQERGRTIFNFSTVNPDIAFHRLLIEHRDIVPEIRVFCKAIGYRENLMKKRIAIDIKIIIQRIRKLYEDNLWDQVKYSLPSHYCQQLLFNQFSDLQVAATLARRIGDRQANVMIYRLCCDNPELMPMLDLACSKKTNNWSKPLSLESYKKIDAHVRGKAEKAQREFRMR